MRRSRRLVYAGLALTALAGPAAAQDNALSPPRESRMVATLGDESLDLFAYRPAGCTPALVLIVFHGVARNAGHYRRYAEPLADTLCAVVLAPRFDRERFPRDLYQYGGVAVAPAGRRTVDLVAELVTWARGRFGMPDRPVVLLGHSAGAQLLDRVAAFRPDLARLVVVANPSTWVEPSITTAAPFGLGGTERANEQGLRAYLAAPLGILLGTADTGSAHLATSAEAMAEGPNRRARGLAAFEAARALAHSHGWSFGWHLAEVAGVGHDAARMFASREAAALVSDALRQGR